MEEYNNDLSYWTLLSNTNILSKKFKHRDQIKKGNGSNQDIPPTTYPEKVISYCTDHRSCSPTHLSNERRFFPRTGMAS
jgi:hypothetical protein